MNLSFYYNKNSITVSMLLLALTACGSAKDEDLKAIEKDSKASNGGNSPNTVIDDKETLLQKKKKKNSVTADSSVAITDGQCSFPLFLGTEATIEDDAQPQLLLVAQVEENCAQASEVTFSFTSDLPITILLPAIRCKASPQEGYTVTCKGKSASLVKENTFRLPILVGGDPEEANINASLRFENSPQSR